MQQRLADPQAGLYCSSLVTLPDRPFAATYLRGMHRGGEIAEPKMPQEVADLLRAIDGLQNLECQHDGNMAYFTRPPGTQVREE